MHRMAKCSSVRLIVHEMVREVQWTCLRISDCYWKFDFLFAAVCTEFEFCRLLYSLAKRSVYGLRELGVRWCEIQQKQVKQV